LDLPLDAALHLAEQRVICAVVSVTH
jgi:hypothetical protein